MYASYRLHYYCSNQLQSQRRNSVVEHYGDSSGMDIHIGWMHHWIARSESVRTRVSRSPDYKRLKRSRSLSTVLGVEEVVRISFYKILLVTADMMPIWASFLSLHWDVLRCIERPSPSWWLKMSWYQICTRPSASIMLTLLWLQTVITPITHTMHITL